MDPIHQKKLIHSPAVFTLLNLLLPDSQWMLYDYCRQSHDKVNNKNYTRKKKRIDPMVTLLRFLLWATFFYLLSLYLFISIIQHYHQREETCVRSPSPFTTLWACSFVHGDHDTLDTVVMPANDGDDDERILYGGLVSWLSQVGIFAFYLPYAPTHSTCSQNTLI